MQLRTIYEHGPGFRTLKDNTTKLTDEEREQIMKAKAVWHHGEDGAQSPAIKKAVVRGKTYYYSNTHRCFASSTTIKGAISKYFSIVEPSS